MTTPAASAILRVQPPALGPERPVDWPKRTVRMLPNGLQVVLVESRTFPKISAQLYFRSGNAVVAHSAPGLAEMTATVVRTGTATRPSRRIEEDLRRMGAGLGTHAGADSSAISASGLAEFSSGILELMADLARNASFPEDEFERERRQRLEELNIERTTPGFLASERLRRVLFGAHPYAVVAPTEEQVASFTARSARGLLSQALRPGRIAADCRRRFLRGRHARRDRENLRRLESPEARSCRRRLRRRANPGAACIWSTCRAPCRRRSCSEISRSRAAIPIGIA